MTSASSVESARATLPDLGFALLVAAVGALGAIPGTRSGPDPVALLVWLALWSAPAGFLCGARGISAWPAAAVPPGLWMGLVSLVDGLSPRDLPSPVFGALAWTGLFALGFGLGRARVASAFTGASAFAGASVLLLVVGLLAALPVAGGFLAHPWPPAISARLLDLSPATLLAECAGLDWMRHPALYEPAGTVDIDPALRVAWRGMLAGPTVLVVGCAVAAAGEWIARARAEADEERWRSTSTSAPSPRT